MQARLDAHLELAKRGDRDRRDGEMLPLGPWIYIRFVYGSRFRINGTITRVYTLVKIRWVWMTLTGPSSRKITIKLHNADRFIEPK